MKAHELISPHFVEGLWKRKWLYLVVVTLSLTLIGRWYINLPVQKFPKDSQKHSFEMLASQINHEDSIFSNSWRKVWPHVPKIIQEKLSKLTPSPPAPQVRISACTMLRGYGEIAFPVVFPKIKSANGTMVEVALCSLLNIGVSNDQTFNAITEIINSNNHSLQQKRIALMTLIGLHYTEPRLLNFLKQAGRTQGTLFESLDPASVDIFSSIGQLNKTISHREWSSTSKLRSTLPPEFIKSLLDTELISIRKLAFYLLHRAFHFRSKAIEGSLKALTLSKDESIRLKSYTYLFDVRFRGSNHRTENQILFKRAAADPSIEIRRIAPSFFAFNSSPTIPSVETLLALANEGDPQLTQNALTVLGRTYFKPRPKHLNILWNISIKQTDLGFAFLLCDIIHKWSLHHHPKVEGLLEKWRQINHPALEQRISEIIASREDKTLGTPEEIINHIQEIHNDICSLSLKSIEYQKSSSNDALPVSWISSMEQLCRRRNGLLRKHFDELNDLQTFLEILAQSAEDPFNPYRVEDTLLRWQVDRDNRSIITILEKNILSPKYQNQVLNTIKSIGPDAYGLLSILLEQENEKSRALGLELICRTIDDYEQMSPFLEKAANDPSNLVRYAAKKLRLHYSRPKQNRGFPRLNIGRY